MLCVIDSHRFAAVVLVVLSQLTGSTIVLCNEGADRQMVEVFPEACCGTATDVSSTESPRLDVDEHPCGPCVDVPLLGPFHRVDDDIWSSVRLELDFVATLPAPHLTRLFSPGAPVRDTRPRVVTSTTVALLAGTVVQLR